MAIDQNFKIILKLTLLDVANKDKEINPTVVKLVEQ